MIPAFLDLDGVSADLNFGLASTLLSPRSTEFDDALQRIDHNESWDEVFGMTTAKIWNVVDGYGDDWWFNLPEVADRFPNVPRFVRLYDSVSEVSEQVRVLTAYPFSSDSPLTSAHASAGKIRWVRHRLGVQFSDIILCKRADKEMLAAPGRVLLDDYGVNCKKWVAAGGGAVHFSPDAPGPIDRAAVQGAIRRASLKNRIVRFA